MIRINISVFCLLALVLGSSIELKAQVEQLYPLNYNHEIKRALRIAEQRGGAYRMAQAANDTIVLPFFDDFSVATVWPATEQWTDSMAFISRGFAINPLTVGVASFDGLDKEGNPYDNTIVGASGLCDELTSRPIDLFADINGLPYNASDSIMLVFYFQREGRGDPLEVNDSIRLDFYNVTTQTWDRIWKVAGGTSGGDTTFTKVKISIDDPAYRQVGFRFRFRNYGSKTGNQDIWNIDYVTLDKFLPPNYENIRDFAWVYEGESLLDEYSAVPWKHYINLPASQRLSMIKTTAKITVRNNNESNPFPIEIAGVSIDQFGTWTQIVGGGGLNNIQVPLNTNVVPPADVDPTFFFDDGSTGEHAPFELGYAIGTTSGIVDNYPVNDTLRYKQDFHNYYSFDDGSAELAYGLNVTGGQMAYKFEILQADTLRAVQYFFTQLGPSVTSQIFKLAVWSGSASPSGAPIYQLFNQTPNYTDSINGFYTYLTDPIFLAAGTYFFGMIQNGNDFLNVGLDMNTPANQSRKFFNINGVWNNSQLPGMWMIRPVLSGTPIDVGVHQVGEQPSFSVYPVPASDKLNVNVDPLLQDQLHTSIYDASGRLVYDNPDFRKVIDITTLQHGLYLVRLTNKQTGFASSRLITVTD